MGLEARIWAFWIGFEPRVWDLGLGTRVWASRLGGTDGQKRRRRRRKFPICVIDPFGVTAQKEDELPHLPKDSSLAPSKNADPPKHPSNRVSIYCTNSDTEINDREIAFSLYQRCG